MKNFKYITYAAIMFIYYFIFVSIAFFFSPFVNETKHIPLEMIGFLQVYGLIFLVLSFIICGMIADKFKCPKFIIILNLVFSAIIFLSLILLNNKILVSILYVLIYPTFMMLASLIDGIVLQNFKIKRYPYIRAFGSLGAAFSYFINTYVLYAFSYYSLIFFQIILMLLLIFLVYIITFEYEKKEKVNYLQAIKELKYNPQILFVLIITFLTYGVLSADDPYAYTYSIDFVGISTFMYGFSGFLSILLEGSLMIFYNTFLKVVGVIPMLVISSFSLFIIYISKYALIGYPFIISLGNIALGIFVATFVPTSIYLIDKYSSDHIKNTMLGVYQSFIKFGGIIVGFITALYYSQNHSLQHIYLLHTIIIMTSFIFIFLLTLSLKNTKHSK